MHRRWLSASAACALVVSLILAGTASADRVTVLGPGGRVQVVNNRFLSGPALTPAPTAVTPPVARAAAAKATTKPKPKGKKPPPQITVVSQLATLTRQRAITPAQHTTYLNEFQGALRTVKRLHGARSAE